ncbi:hypothetical protein NQ318_017337 [Aromia moschata]|uniref:SAP domain-containing protein n=1 Tax=Aromia moschata TaxID=1265417 RepID=A0AAV8XWI5_9CUCU|nr:hypothetical protein NQ318_017337 [Aromia moschata]
MASRQVFLKDLKVADLKRELEERECETTGKKADLQNRLREVLEKDGENPDTYLFEIAGDINLALQSLEKNLEHKLEETSGKLEQKLIDNFDQKLQENSSCLQKQMSEYVDEKFEEIEKVERKIATLSLGKWGTTTNGQYCAEVTW